MIKNSLAVTKSGSGTSHVKSKSKFCKRSKCLAFQTRNPTTATGPYQYIILKNIYYGNITGNPVHDITIVNINNITISVKSVQVENLKIQPFLYTPISTQLISQS